MKLSWLELEKRCLQAGFVKDDFIQLVKDIKPNVEQYQEMERHILDQDVLKALIETHSQRLMA